jgi:hypothetical protein
MLLGDHHGVLQAAPPTKPPPVLAVLAEYTVPPVLRPAR